MELHASWHAYCNANSITYSEADSNANSITESNAKPDAESNANAKPDTQPVTLPNGVQVLGLVAVKSDQLIYYHPLQTPPPVAFISSGLLLPLIFRCMTGKSFSTDISVSIFRHITTISALWSCCIYDPGVVR